MSKEAYPETQTASNSHPGVKYIMLDPKISLE